MAEMLKREMAAGVQMLALQLKLTEQMVQTILALIFQEHWVKTSSWC